MVGMVSNSSTITITLSGHSCKHQLFSSGSYDCRTHYLYIPSCVYLCSGIKSNIWRAKSYGLNMVSMFKERHALSGVSQLEFPQNKFMFGSPMCNDSFNVQQKIARLELGPACEEGNIMFQKGKDDNENRIFFLEEKNEEILSKRIVKLSRSNKSRSAMELYRSMEYSGLRPNLHACNSLISCLLRNHMLDDALRIFEFLKTSETITGHTYSLVLKALANGRGCEEALDLFEELKSRGHVKKDFDVVAYNTIISICGKLNNWVQALRIWRYMKDNGVAGTVVTYRLLVCIFVRCGQSEVAIDAYLEMVQNRFNPGEDEMQAVIGACSKEGKWELALKVFESMLEKGLRPTLITCNALINAQGKEGKVKLAFSTYRLMKSLGHSPDEYTWKALLNALYRANRHADVLKLFERIKKEQSSQLNLHLYNTCLMSCQSLGLWDKSLKLLWDMEASGFPISAASYNLVIGACESARKPKIALQVYEHMVHQKCDFDLFTLLSLIRCCIWGSLWYEVEELLNVMPNASLYNAAIQGMCLRGKIDLATKLYTKMRNSNLKPDGKTRALMLQNMQKDSIRKRNR